MISLEFLSADKGALEISPSPITSITFVRCIFYIACIAILLSLSFMTDKSKGLSAGSLYIPLMYFGIGIVAATIANSTGAGGGIVFLPIFMGLGFSPIETLATSIAIQCFGMSSGALAWLSYQIKEKEYHPKQWQVFPSILIISASSSLIGVILTQQRLPHPPIDIEFLFSIFSLIIGSVILVRSFRTKQEALGRENFLTTTEKILLACASFIGGAMTAWISIGIGEILLIFLIFLGFRLNVAVAAAVCVSAINVLVAVPHHIQMQSISIEVLIYAAPGALIGGVIARYLAIHLGAQKLKAAASGWIILSATPYLVMSLT